MDTEDNKNDSTATCISECTCILFQDHDDDWMLWFGDDKAKGDIVEEIALATKTHKTRTSAELLDAEYKEFLLAMQAARLDHAVKHRSTRMLRCAAGGPCKRPRHGLEALPTTKPVDYSKVMARFGIRFEMHLAREEREERESAQKRKDEWDAMTEEQRTAWLDGILE